ncbi:DNA-formamidopyrimidine glycosylase family protein [Microbacterium sp. NPDC091313]
MPESPEVDVLTDVLRDTLAGRRMASVDVAEFRALKTRARPVSELVGRTVTDVVRHGKHIAVHTDGPVLVISFGRAGWAAWRPDPAASADPPAPVIVTIVFEDAAELALTDAGGWLSLGVFVVDSADDVPAVAKLGPDPLADDWSAADLDRIAVGRRKRLKALLQEQESIAGIGNAYSDEILYDAALPPLVAAADLDDDQRARLHASVVGVLRSARDDRRGVPIAELKAAKVAAMRVHGRAGEPCAAGGVVLDVPGSKGAAQYCPARQTGGEVLAQ